MSNEIKLTVDPYRQMRINKIDVDRDRADKFLQVIERAYKTKNPAKEDLKEIRIFLIDYPQFCKAVFALSDNLQNLLIQSVTGDKVATIAMEEYAVTVRDEMGYHEAPIMEKLLIDNIVTAWLHVQFCHSQVVFRLEGQYPLTVLEFWERRLTIAQKRYLSACETLAKIRKMALPALQLNIGDKQVNVAGNLRTVANSR